MQIPPDPKRLEELKRERTLVLIKPDAVSRHIVGEIISRFECKGLQITALKLVWPSRELAEQHYTDSEDWIESSGARTHQSYLDKGTPPPAGPRDLALNTRRRLIESITTGPVVAMVLQGAHVIEAARKMRGHTSPQLSTPGTIGFDFSVESYDIADAGDWAIKNIIHSSDSPETAEQEIAMWFKSEEIVDYETQISKVFYRKDWHKQ
jgi:nucleoside-diphosphate kinase